MGDLRLGLQFNYTGMDAASAVSLARRAESLGFWAIWTSEAYGTDAVVPLAWMAAHTTTIKLGTGILQMPARTPAMTAMTAITLDELSGGRVLLGLGTSGPQVVEGWHGQPYGRPLARTREYVEIIRRILRREAPLEFEGETYQVPYRGPDATGLGKPLKTILRPRADLPIYLAAIGPRNVSLAAEIADGFLPLFWSPTRWRDAFGEPLAAVNPAAFDIAASAWVAVGDDLDACRDQVRPFIGLYVGGMGARGRNFYNDLACRFGFEEAAAEIQDRYLDGDAKGAIAAVPDALVDEVAFVGGPDRIADRLAAWRESPVTTINVWTEQPHALDLIAEAAAR